MIRRRIISLALPHLGAEHALRREGRAGAERPFATAAQDGGTQRLASLNRAALAAGLAPGMGLADARAICPELALRPAEPARLAAFRRALARWAEAFSPLVGEDAAGALTLDATGAAHLWGGEREMLDALVAGLAARGLTARAAMADTRGAAWALAHFAASEEAPTILAPAGRTRAALAPLPVAALRIAPAEADALAATGLGTIGEIAGIARGPLARRFGLAVMKRLDQAMGAEPEPVSPARAAPVFAARLSLAEPIGRVDDVLAGLDHLLERVCRDLERERQGARAMRLVARRVDGADEVAAIRLARPLRDPMRLRELFRPKLEALDAGYGIDALRLEAGATEALVPSQTGVGRGPSESDRLADLLSRIGNRIGFENVTRLLPAESHIPERAFVVAAAAWSEPGRWLVEGRPAAPLAGLAPRPVTLFPPEPVMPIPSEAPPASGAESPAPGLEPGAPGASSPRRPGDGDAAALPAPPSDPEGSPPNGPIPGREASPAGCTLSPQSRPPGSSSRSRATALPPPARFRWRGMTLSTLHAAGPERIAPEWWWDDPDWRSGMRDYWRVETAEGPRLWLFHTPGADRPGWSVHGSFA